MNKKLNITYNKNKKIIGNLHVNEKSKDLIILCHGYKDTKDLHVYKKISELLQDRYNVYRFNFTDNTEPNLFEEVDNITVITEYFSKKYKEIIIIGASIGGLSTILNLVSNSRINKTIFVNPFIFFFKRVAWRFRKILISMLLFYPFIKSTRNNLNFYFKFLKPQLITIPSLLIVAENDDKVDSSHGKTFYNQLSSKQKKLIVDENIDHGLTKEVYIETVVNYIIEWLK